MHNLIPMRFKEREADWRMGATVYQVMPDRFHARDLDSKQSQYDAPKRLAPWTEPSRRGEPLANEGVWSHELTFYGGDLPGLIDKIPYIRDLGASVLLLTPVFDARTCHGYDTIDYHRIAPHLGTRDDLAQLVRMAHDNGMRVVLDGVFNHVSQQCPWLREAVEDPHSEKRAWFDIDPDRYEHGYRSWCGIKNLPELQVETASLRDELYRSESSVVRSYLRELDIDGWRLDVAWELGLEVLTELVEHARREKAQSVVLGEIWSALASPLSRWAPPLDGLLHMSMRELLLHWIAGRVPGPRVARVLQTMVDDAGIEAMLRSHLVVENHDTPRIHSLLPDPALRSVFLHACMALPGCFSFLYGMEVGLEGMLDPEMRGPMSWDLAHDGNATFDWTKKLLVLRRELRALRIGDFVALDTDGLLAFQRVTDRYEESVWFFANVTDESVTETVYLRDAKLMNGNLVDRLSDDRAPVHCGFCEVTVEAASVRMLMHPSHAGWAYNPYKRVR